MKVRTLTRWCLPLLVAGAAFVAGAPTAAGEEAGGANNVVIATTTADGSSLDRSALQVSLAGGPTVASSNIAAATSYAGTGCHSVAVAFQAVVVTGDPSVVVPKNAAAASNAGCESCTSYAFAYQYVVSVQRPAYLDPSAQAEITAVRAEIADVAASGLPPDEMKARLDAINDEFEAAINAALHPVSAATTIRVAVAPAS